MRSVHIAVLLSISLTFLSVVEVRAQFQDVIATGRPGQSIGAFVVGTGIFQLQSGFTLAESKGSSEIIHTTVLRQGLNERFELSAVFGWTRSKASPQLISSAMTDALTRIDNVQIGGRVHLLDNDGFIPSLAFQVRAIIPTDASVFEESLGIRILIPAVHSLADDWSMTTNLGADRFFLGDGVPDPMRYFYTLSVGYSVTDDLGAFVEVFGDLDDFSSDYDMGLSYVINSDLAVDLSGGLTGIEGAYDPFLDFGVSWRLGKTGR